MIEYYYPRTLKAISVAILNMFNDMKVVKYDKDGNTLFEKDVPITWGPVEKYHHDRIENHYVDADGIEHNVKYYPQIPRLALVLNGIAHDPNRAVGSNEWRHWFAESLGLDDTEIETVYSDYQPTPYNYNFILYIKADSTDYLAQILENILPYFNPKLFLRVKEFSFLNIERDLPVSMDGVNPEFADEMNESDTKFVNATINLTVEGWAYRKVLSSAVIKMINTQYFRYNTSAYMEGFSISAVQTSAGIPIETSAIPTSGDYYISGAYPTSGSQFTSGIPDVSNKEYIWFQTHHSSAFS